MGSDARHTAQPRPASPSQGNTSTPAGPGGCHATSQPASPSESRGRRHLPHRGNVGSKSPAWLQAHRERFPNQCPPLHPAFLPKSLFGYLGLERSQVLSSTTALLPRSADAPMHSGNPPHCLHPRDSHAGERCPQWTFGTALAMLPGSAWPHQSRAGSGQSHKLLCASSLGVEVHNTLLDATPGTGALGAPPRRAFQNHCPIAPGGAGTQ